MIMLIAKNDNKCNVNINNNIYSDAQRNNNINNETIQKSALL